MLVIFWFSVSDIKKFFGKINKLVNQILLWSLILRWKNELKNGTSFKRVTLDMIFFPKKLQIQKPFSLTQGFLLPMITIHTTPPILYILILSLNKSLIMIYIFESFE